MNSISEAQRQVARARSQKSPQLDLPGYFAKLQGTVQMSWREVSAESIHQAVSALSEAGYALTLGRTSDGGALSIAVLTGATPVKLYATSAEQAESLLSHLAAWPDR